jgi:hypothetical protein
MDPFRNYDAWLERDNPANDPEPPECDKCGQHMEWEEDAERCEETGRVVSAGGSWSCMNQDCGLDNEDRKPM